jgi:hypothetical protein
MKSANREDLILSAGQEVRFPLEPSDPLARFQTLKTVDSIDDIAEFEFVKLWRHLGSRAGPGAAVYESADESQRFFHGLYPSETMLLKEVRRLGRLMELTLADFIVPAGATVVLGNPLNKIDANRVIISGTLRVEGHIVITARELGG